MTRHRGADRREYAEFVAARSGALHRAAYLMVGDVGLAQDLVQEALVKTYVAWPRLHATGNAEAYTRKVITTTAISWFRRRGWRNERPTAELPELSTRGHDEDVERAVVVWDCVQSLPVRQRATIVLRFYEDLTEAQSAAALGCAVGTVKSQTSAALASLRDRLATYFGDEPDLLARLLDDAKVTR